MAGDNPPEAVLPVLRALAGDPRPHELGGFEQPRSVDFVDELPRSATGKVLKLVLRERYWAGQARRVGGASRRIRGPRRLISPVGALLAAPVAPLPRRT